jgi:hypothetical protein
VIDKRSTLTRSGVAVAMMEAVRSMQFKPVALLLAHGAREDQVAKDGTAIDLLMAEVPRKCSRTFLRT